MEMTNSSQNEPDLEQSSPLPVRVVKSVWFAKRILASVKDPTHVATAAACGNQFENTSANTHHIYVSLAL